MHGALAFVAVFLHLTIPLNAPAQREAKPHLSFGYCAPAEELPPAAMDGEFHNYVREIQSDNCDLAWREFHIVLHS